MRRETEETMEDRISNLPDHVLHQILRLLPLKDAIRMSILSKRWRKMDVCSTFSDINFMEGFFDNISSLCYIRKNARKKVRRSLNILDKLLQRRRGSDLNIQKFKVLIPSKYKRTSEDDYRPFVRPFELICQCPLQRKLDTWMKVVASPGLTILDLRILFPDGEYYNFPLTTLAAAKSLRILSLEGFQLSWHGMDVSFPCLEQINLDSVVLNDFVMQKLLEVSPLLENLRLDYCKGLKILKVEGLGRLKMLDVDCAEKIVIDAPCLRDLSISANSQNVINMTTCPQFLRKLCCCLSETPNHPPNIQSEGRQLPIEDWFCRLTDKFRFLEHLILICTPSMRKINISSTLHMLKTLYLDRLTNLVSFEVIAPNLEKFYVSPTHKLPFICLNASENLQVELDLTCFHIARAPDNMWYKQWTEFLSFFKHSRSLIIKAYDEKRCIVPKESRKDLARTLLGVKSLEMKTYAELPGSFLDDIDYMLWLSPRPTDLTSRKSNYRLENWEVVIKFVSDETKITDRGEGSCCEDCDLLKVRCWQHSLKQVSLDKFVGDEMMKRNIKNFFHEQVENQDFIKSICDPDSLEAGLYYYYDKLFK